MATDLMVNYKYEMKTLEKNHEKYFSEGIIAAPKKLRSHSKAITVTK